MVFRVEPVAGSLGAVLDGIDVRDLDEAGIETLREHIHTYEVVFLPGQHLDDDEQLTLGAQLGPLRGFAFASVLGGVDDDAPPTLTAIRDSAESPPATDGWHTDVTWTAEPPDYAVLRAVTVPESGGDTMWASLTAAYRDLSDTMRRFIDDLVVVHDNSTFIESVREKMGAEQFEALEIGPKLQAGFPPVHHPLVRTHPDTGARALFLAGNFMRYVEGLTAAESDNLLGFLAGHLDQHRFHLRWRWHEGDVVIWDERTTNHRGVSDHFPQEREVRRIEVGGSVPV
ncbi:MAG: TauD/TfdA dioxygenase family protein [Acidimicrobiales bacterium]